MSCSRVLRARLRQRRELLAVMETFVLERLRRIPRRTLTLQNESFHRQVYEGQGFEGIFRMSRVRFEELYMRIREHLPERARSKIPDRIVLAAVLKYLAQGLTATQIQQDCGISSSHFNDLLPPVSSKVSALV